MMGPGPFDPSELSGAPELVLLLVGVLAVCVLLGAVYVAVDALRKKR
jgi:hypothetical protein